MALLTPSMFVRRLTAHRATESICTRCSLTVATAKREEELDKAEQSHICDSWLLEQWKQMFEHSPAHQEAGHFSFTPSQSPSPAQVPDRSRFRDAEKPPARPRPEKSSFAEFRRRTFETKSKPA